MEARTRQWTSSDCNKEHAKLGFRWGEMGAKPAWACFAWNSVVGAGWGWLGGLRFRIQLCSRRGGA